VGVRRVGVFLEGTAPTCYKISFVTRRKNISRDQTLLNPKPAKGSIMG
jgi:hypothetical protein